MHPRNSPAERLLVLGLDGATFDVLWPLIDQGRMPNLARLVRRSAAAQCRSTRPTITPVAWTTFQTGADPREHGILDFRYYDHLSGHVQLNHSGRIGRPTLFDAVAAAGGQVVSLNLPMTYPAPPGVPGIIVGGLDSLSIEAALAPYPDFSRRLLSASAKYHLATIWKSAPLGYDELQQKVAQTESAFHSRSIAARLADELVDWQLMVVQFQTLDSMQHRCWHLLGVEPWCTGPLAWVDRTQQAFRALDQCLGELCEMADRRRAAVAVVSDHGFGPFHAKISLPRLLANAQLLYAARGPASWWYRAARTRWKLRQWAQRRWHSELRQQGINRPLEALLPIDRRRSRAVALHGSLAALVYLNTPARFGRGPVRSAAQYEQASSEVLAALSQARNPQDGQPLFDEAYSVAQRFDFDPLDRDWPDIVAIPAEGYHIRHKVDRLAPIVCPDDAMRGTHREMGIFLLDAPGVRTGDAHTLALRDVAPTLLSVLGLPPGPEMSGRVRHELFESEPRSIPSPHRRRGARPAEHARAQLPFDAQGQAQVEHRLRELGYLD